MRIDQFHWVNFAIDLKLTSHDPIKLKFEPPIRIIGEKKIVHTHPHPNGVIYTKHVYIHIQYTYLLTVKVVPITISKIMAEEVFHEV